MQTPLRVSLFGGGTDFPSFYCNEGGAVLSSAIDKYIFITIKQRFDQKLRIGYTHTEMVDHIDEVQHELIRKRCVKQVSSRGLRSRRWEIFPQQAQGWDLPVR